MKQPFESYRDLHEFRMVNCEGCDKWSCLFKCEIWDAFSRSVRCVKGDPLTPVSDQILLDSGYVEGQKTWPCKQFKDYGYVGFVPGVGRKEK
jgi:hypothetical protein